MSSRTICLFLGLCAGVMMKVLGNNPAGRYKRRLRWEVRSTRQQLLSVPKGSNFSGMHSFNRAKILFLILETQQEVNTNRKSREVIPSMFIPHLQDQVQALHGVLQTPVIGLPASSALCSAFPLALWPREPWDVTFLHKRDHLILSSP